MAKKKTYLEFITQIEDERRKALESQNAAKFAAISDYLGISPDEDGELYDLGHLNPSYSNESGKIDRMYAFRFGNHNNGSKKIKSNNKQMKIKSSNKQKKVKLNKKPNYQGFLAESKSLGVPWRWEEYPRTKRGLLEKYFPREFPEGKLDDYRPAQVGKAYLGVLNYAKGINKNCA